MDVSHWEPALRSVLSPLARTYTQGIPAHGRPTSMLTPWTASQVDITPPLPLPELDHLAPPLLRQKAKLKKTVFYLVQNTFLSPLQSKAPSFEGTLDFLPQLKSSESRIV